MMRTVAAFVAASLGTSILLPAVCASARAAESLGSAGRREPTVAFTSVPSARQAGEAATVLAPAPRARHTGEATTVFAPVPRVRHTGEAATVFAPAPRVGIALEWTRGFAPGTRTDAPGTSDTADARPARGQTSPGSSPFAIVPEEPPDRGSHRLSWASFITGAGLVGLSFALTDRANDAYDDYLVATNPADAEHLYDRTRHYDRLSAASLLTGEALVATAVWLRFIRPRPDARITLVAEPDRCAVALRF